MKLWLQGTLDKCSKQVATLLGRGWIVQSCASQCSHTASVILARKQEGMWRFCQNYCCLNTITQHFVEPLPQVEQLVN